MGQDIKPSVDGILVHLEWKLQGLPTVYGHERKTDYYFDKMSYFIMQLYSSNCVFEHFCADFQMNPWYSFKSSECLRIRNVRFYKELYRQSNSM